MTAKYHLNRRQVVGALKWGSKAAKWLKRSQSKGIELQPSTVKHVSHHGLIFISGMGAHVKKTVSSKKDLRPQTSDNAPIRGALRKDNRPWGYKDNRREDGWVSPFIIWQFWQHTRAQESCLRKDSGCQLTDENWAGASVALYFWFGELFCFKQGKSVKESGQPQSSAKQVCRKIKDSLWEKGPTAAAYRAKKVQKCYLDTMDEPIHEECVLGKRLV